MSEPHDAEEPPEVPAAATSHAGSKPILAAEPQEDGVDRLTRFQVFCFTAAVFGVLIVGGFICLFAGVELDKHQFVSIPLSAVFFGMLGALLCSLQGIIRHDRTYDRAYNYWYLARPLVGGVVGLVSYLFLSVVVFLGGADPPKAVDPPAVLGLTIYHAVAFVVGYREEAFRELLSRATDLILRPSDRRKTDGK